MIVERLKDDLQMRYRLQHLSVSDAGFQYEILMIFAIGNVGIGVSVSRNEALRLPYDALRVHVFRLIDERIVEAFKR